MTTEYAASVRIEDGNLTVTRPHPAPGPVDDLVDDLVYRIRDGATILGVEMTVEVDTGPDTGDEQPTTDPDVQPQTTTPRVPGTPGAGDTPALSASATGSLNPPVPAPDPLAPSGN
jgi:hypothetical protein